MNTEKLDCLRQKIRCNLSADRYEHTLGVERAVVFIGERILPHKLYELRVAALLHDITKEMPYADQKHFLATEGVQLTCDDVMSEKTLHQLSGAKMAEKSFSDYITPEIIHAISCHSTGCADMSVFDEILYLADYVEDTRRHESCIALRNRLLDELKKSSAEDYVQVLHKICLESINQTIEHLIQKGGFVHSNSFAARAFLVEKLNNGSRE
ncbi:MAG: HD domain-containing protein [Clostridia bacterium]|nr:HD domain-containing protein [Clostridia bacterium]